MNGQEQGSAIRINQEGYAAGLPVHAAVLAEGRVTLRDETGRTVREIDVKPPETDAASGDRVALVNLGRLGEGVYTLSAGGAAQTIRVRKDPWRAVTDGMIKGLYFQRCGCELPARYAGPYRHPACHTAEVSGWEDRSLRRKVPGGWHDAGDYGKYVGPGAVTAAHLIYAWKLFPDGCSDDLDIPETGNGVPDILNETRYELDWMLRMQREDGAFYHKLTKDHFAPFIMPQDDTEPEYLMPVSHCATAAACACLALAARAYRAYDADFCERALRSALQAWEWLRANPEFIPYRNPEGVRTGWYGDRSDADERFWAACELYAATGENEYREAAEALYAQGMQLIQFGWADVGGLGALCCLFDLRERAGDILYGALREDFLRQSEEGLAWSRQSGYGTSLAPDRYIWGSILPIMSHAMAMILNARLTGREDMRDAALIQWDYALGLNALDLCFVTGFGERRVMHPHHRPSEADGVSDPVPGLISGGPNKGFPYPFTRDRLKDRPPAKSYLDETPSADTNEIAIYWNSPAIFVGAYFRSSVRGK